MAELFVQFDAPVEAKGGGTYTARVCGREAEDGKWEGWLEFIPVGDPIVQTIRSRRETTQPNRDALLYWATGLGPAYLEGSLERALSPAPGQPRKPPPPPVYDRPAPDPRNETRSDARMETRDTTERGATSARAILDPFAVYAQGEDILAAQLKALSPAQLVNIAIAYDLLDANISSVHDLSRDALIDQIMRSVMRQS